MMMNNTHPIRSYVVTDTAKCWACGEDGPKSDLALHLRREHGQERGHEFPAWTTGHTENRGSI